MNEDWALRLEALRAALEATRGYDESGRPAPGKPTDVVAAAEQFRRFLDGSGDAPKAAK
jgi:hypothetical protein